MSDIEHGTDAETDVSIPDNKVKDNESLIDTATGAFYQEEEDSSHRVKKQLDVWYKPSDDPTARPNKKHYLDIYMPMDEGETAGGDEEEGDKKKSKKTPTKGAKVNKPVIMFIHGGGWKTRDRSEYDHVGEAWASQDYVVCVISYRLTKWNWVQVCGVAFICAFILACFPWGEVHVHVFVACIIFFLITGILGAVNKSYSPVYHPFHVYDCADALKWILTNITQYGGDPTRIFLCGHSAGGHLAALLSLDEQYIKAVSLKPNYLRLATKGLILISAPLDSSVIEQNLFTKFLYGYCVFGRTPLLWPDAFPLAHAGAHCPPLLILNAKNEKERLTDTSETLIKKLKRHHTPIEHEVIDHADHMSIIKQVGSGSEWDLVTPIVMDFISRRLSPRTIRKTPK